MKARFRILRTESEQWSVKNFVAATEVCAILHNLLIRMAQSGGFDGVASEGDGTVDILTQFFNEENGRLRDRGDEVARQEAIDGTSNTFKDLDVDERERINAFLDELEAMHYVIADEDEHSQLRNDLISRFTDVEETRADDY